MVQVAPLCSESLSSVPWALIWGKSRSVIKDQPKTEVCPESSENWLLVGVIPWEKALGALHVQLLCRKTVSSLYSLGQVIRKIFGFPFWEDVAGLHTPLLVLLYAVL